MNKFIEIMNTKVPLLSWSVENDGVRDIYNITTTVDTILSLGVLLAVIIIGARYVGQ